MAHVQELMLDLLVTKDLMGGMDIQDHTDFKGGLVHKDPKDSLATLENLVGQAIKGKRDLWGWQDLMEDAEMMGNLSCGKDLKE